MAVKAMPDGYHRVTPYLVVPGVATRLDCLTQAFEAHELHRVPQPDGTIIHAVVRMGDAREAGRTEVRGAAAAGRSFEDCTKEDSMPEEHDDVMAPERAGAPRTVVYTTLYDLIAAVDAEVEPGEEACVVPIVAHLLRVGHAQFLREVDVEWLCTALAPACLQAEALGVPV
jgi:hypothetical protein